VKYDLSFVMTAITVTCYSLAQSSCDHLFHVAPSTVRHNPLGLGGRSSERSLTLCPNM